MLWLGDSRRCNFLLGKSYRIGRCPARLHMMGLALGQRSGNVPVLLVLRLAPTSGLRWATEWASSRGNASESPSDVLWVIQMVPRLAAVWPDLEQQTAPKRGSQMACVMEQHWQSGTAYLLARLKGSVMDDSMWVPP